MPETIFGLSEETVARICGWLLLAAAVLAVLAILVDAKVLPAPGWAPMNPANQPHYHPGHVVTGLQQSRGLNA